VKYSFFIIGEDGLMPLSEQTKDEGKIKGIGGDKQKEEEKKKEKGKEAKSRIRRRSSINLYADMVFCILGITFTLNSLDLPLTE
jgi:hypothetical protein